MFLVTLVKYNFNLKDIFINSYIIDSALITIKEKMAFTIFLVSHYFSSFS